jgi:hypothetical protein
MKALPKSQILRFTEKAIRLARRTVSSTPRTSLNTAIHFLNTSFCCVSKFEKNTTYRGLLDELIEMPHISRALELAKLPTASTLCEAFNRLDIDELSGSSSGAHSAMSYPTRHAKPD